MHDLISFLGVALYDLQEVYFKLFYIALTFIVLYCAVCISVKFTQVKQSTKFTQHKLLQLH